MESRQRKVAVRKAGAASNEDVSGDPAAKPARTNRAGKGAKANGAGDAVVPPPPQLPKAKATKKVTVPKAPRAKTQDPKEGTDSKSESSPEPGPSRATYNKTPYPSRMDFSSSPENSGDEKKDEVKEPEPIKKKITKKAVPKSKKEVGPKKAEAGDVAEDKEMDIAAANVSGSNSDEVEKAEEPVKKTKAVKKDAPKPKVGSKRTAPPSPKPEVESDEAADPAGEASTPPEKVQVKKTVAARKGPVKGKIGAKKVDPKPADKPEAGSNDEEKAKPEPEGKTTKPPAKRAPRGKKVAEETKDQNAEIPEEKPSAVPSRAAAKGPIKKAPTKDKKPTRGKGQAQAPVSEDEVEEHDAVFSNESAEVIDASSSDEGKNLGGVPMDTSTEELAQQFGLSVGKTDTYTVTQQNKAAVKEPPPQAAVVERQVASPGSGSGSAEDDNRAVSDFERSSGSTSDNKENDLDVVMDNLQIISEESDENAGNAPPKLEPEPLREPSKRKPVPSRKKLEALESFARKPKAGPSVANRAGAAKNRTMPPTLESAKSTTGTEEPKKTLARKSYATRSKAKRAGTSDAASATATFAASAASKAKAKK